MFRSTAIFLVLLRLAIGWHFLFEGLEKVRSLRIGPSETNRPFSSAGYFREAGGPLGGWMREAVGDPYEEARARLIPKPRPDGPMEKPYLYIPPALERDWEDYARRFGDFYALDASQKERVATQLQQAKSNVVVYLTWTDKNGPFRDDKEKEDRGVRKSKKTYPTGVVEVEETVPERVAEYVALLDDVRKTEPSKLYQMGKDVEKQRLLKAKLELETKRSALMKELDEKTAALKKGFNDVLTPEQNKEGAAKTAARRNVPIEWLPDNLKERGEVPDVEGGFLYWLDRVTAYSLLVMGACLVLGLLTRLNCVLLAGFLLMTYLAVPALPWLPVPPNSEGNYYFINKNVIEMLALLALATTYSGRWLGLDALIHYLIFGPDKENPESKTNGVTTNESANIAPATR